MRTVIVAVLFCAVRVPALAGGYDGPLSPLLARDLEKRITALPSGRELYARLEKAGPAARSMRVLLRRDPGNWIASFSPEDNAVYFNARMIAGFFGMKDAPEGAVAALLYRNPAARAALSSRADVTFLHESVHALQFYLYPRFRRDVPGGAPLEFEYEAYLRAAVYTHEKMLRAPEELAAFLRGGRRDVYTMSAMNGYLALSLDPDAYKKKIRGLYEGEAAGFISFENAEKLRSDSAESSRILAYASGRTGDYAGKRGSLEEVRLEKKAYDKFLKDFYERTWPSFSADALFFLGSAALKEKLYPLALDCLAVADANAAKNGVPAGEVRKLREKGALAILEASAFIKDKAPGMGLEELARQLKALEKACANTGRPFPGSLAEVRDGAYPGAYKLYSEKAAAEKDPRKAGEYAEEAAFFHRVTPGRGGGP